MLAISQENVNEVKKLHESWRYFKNQRLKGKYETKYKAGYITSLEREDMLDLLFSIILYKTEKLKVVEI